ncbi:hypothetical protein ACVINW_003701 [Bradyrhizobium sp. USDA 4461]
MKALADFFEAPWLFKRAGAWDTVYAANNAGRILPALTPSTIPARLVHAPTPLEPWADREADHHVTKNAISIAASPPVSDGRRRRHWAWRSDLALLTQNSALFITRRMPHPMCRQVAQSDAELLDFG